MAERTRYYSVRPRRVAPEFCTDESLESCSVLAALLFYRLISQADDQGRLQGHPKSLRGSCFPMRPEVTERKVLRGLNELVDAGFVIRYQVERRTYVQINHWFDLQGKWAQRRTYASRYPAPPGWTGDWVTVGADEPEVPAPGAHGAGSVRPPTSPSSSSSSPAPPAGLINGPLNRSRPERIGDLLERGIGGQLTEDEAIELGTAVAADEQSSRQVR